MFLFCHVLFDLPQISQFLTIDYIDKYSCQKQDI